MTRRAVEMLQSIRDNLIEEISQVPEYRAMKIVEAAIAQVNELMEAETPQEPAPATVTLNDVNNRRVAQVSQASPRITAYSPTPRVA